MSEKITYIQSIDLQDVKDFWIEMEVGRKQSRRVINISLWTGPDLKWTFFDHQDDEYQGALTSLETARVKRAFS